MSTTKEEMYSHLFNRILQGEYQNGTRLKEVEIAEEFGISRTPVREVLMQLAQDGLVEINPNKGATVHPLTPDDVEEIFELRKHLELLALEFSVHRINLNILQDIRKNITENLKKKDFQSAMTNDFDLHRYIVDSSNKRRLITMVNQLLRVMQKFRYMGFHNQELFERVNREHLELIEALSRRDLENSKKILAAHLDESKHATLRMIFEEKFFIDNLSE